VVGLNKFLAPPLLERTTHPEIILDSGAYSVWRSGAEVDVDRYIRYCEIVKPLVLGCVNLDVIPGQWGRTASREEVADACELSFHRWHRMNRTGALMMPVYHQGDALVWLDKYIDAGAKWICISPTDSFSTPVRQKWLHDVHEYMTMRGVRLNQDVFTHCLGVFAPKLLYDIPCWSADASSIVRFAVWKRIMWPKRENGRICAWHSALLSTHTKQKEAVDFNAVAEYLDIVQVPYEWTANRKGILLADHQDFIRVNLRLALDVMRETGVRIFIAGEDRPSMYRIIVTEAYPYILRSFAVIKEQTGDLIRKVYDRSLERPARRPEQDREVVAARSLFPLERDSGGPETAPGVS
jgi:hypothetical protein